MQNLNDTFIQPLENQKLLAAKGTDASIHEKNLTFLRKKNKNTLQVKSAAIFFHPNISTSVFRKMSDKKIKHFLRNIFLTGAKGIFFHLRVLIKPGTGLNSTGAPCCHPPPPFPTPCW